MDSIFLENIGRHGCYPGCNTFRKSTFVAPQDSFLCIMVLYNLARTFQTRLLYVLYFVFVIIIFGYLNPTQTHSLNFTVDYCRCFVISFFSNTYCAIVSVRSDLNKIAE